MKKNQKSEKAVLVKASAVAEVIRQAEVVRRDLEIDSLDAHLVGCPLDLVRAARYAVRKGLLTVDEAARGVKAEAEKRRAAIAKEDRERRAKWSYESEKSREEKKFADALERINSAIEAESDPFLKGFLLSAIPEEPAILRDGSAPVKTHKEKTEKATTVKAPREGTRTSQIEAMFPATKTEICKALNLDSVTFSKYLTSYKGKGKWSVSSDGTISLA